MGFSGADLAELCQRAAKAAVRDSINAEELRGQIGKSIAEDDDEDDIQYITRRHFEEAFAGARRSVSVADLAKYDQFKMKFSPSYLASGPNTASGPGQQQRNSAFILDWPDAQAHSKVRKISRFSQFYEN